MNTNEKEASLKDQSNDSKKDNLDEKEIDEALLNLENSAENVIVKLDA